MFRRCLAVLLTLSLPALAESDPDLFAKDNLMAWCIVPFDGMKRGPEARAEMLEKLGLKHFAYDYRAEQIPTWGDELDALKRHGISLDAWWFPNTLNDEAKKALELFQRHHVHPQLWVTGGGAPTKSPEEQAQRVDTEAKRIRLIAEAAAQIGCKVGLYNHEQWFGEPENEIAIIEQLKKDGVNNVGLVYNFHHGHSQLDRFPELLEKMKPYLLAINLDGMFRDGNKIGRQIVPIGQGDLDLQLLRTIRDSGWQGPIGVLNHTGEDAEARLQDNLDGLAWLDGLLHGQRTPQPVPRSWRAPAWPPIAGDKSDGDELIIPAATDDELTRANGWPADTDMRKWERSLGGETSNRFTTLKQITKANVGKLEMAWTYHSGDGTSNIQCNPIIVDGVMFAPTGGWNIVALDATTGRELWRFTPEHQGKRLEDQPARRGLLYWKGDGDNRARVLFGAGNWIYALDPQTGKVIDSFGKNGRTDIPTAATAVGAIYRDVLVVAGYLGDIFGYDVRTGEPLWTFHTKPLPGEYGHNTWSHLEQGANCWGGMALDESRGIAYISTGSPKPNYLGMNHTGDNLFGDCVIAIDALTGKRVWHFQEIRHDVWDWDIPAPPNLVTVERNGIKVDAVAQVTKLGNTLLLDRTNGKPLFPYRLKRVKTELLPGDQAAPFEPMPELPEPFARQAFTPNDIPASPDVQAVVLPVIQRANTGAYPSIQPAKPTLLFNIHGGAEWTGATANPGTGMLYVTANEIPWFVTSFRDDDPEPAKPPTAGEQAYMTICVACHGPDRKGIGHAPPLRGVRHRLNEEQILEQLKNGRGSMPPMLPALKPEQVKPLIDFLLCRDRPIPPLDPKAPPKWTFGGWNRLQDAQGYPGCTPPWGTLTCVNLNTGKIAWKVPFGEYPELAEKGVPKTGQENFGGAMLTSTGVIVAGGTRDKKVRAFDASNGDELWSYQLPLHSTAPPASYEANGRQFIVVPVTGGGKLGGPTGDAWMAFALPK
ncbi:Pyrrolo-quinoline quinone [Chthoniobacter flavus Ellin428]|uniref:Pyrrolo-quinoline quinone n=1 Tax=Chthoniobacter flavus Ellin428 TaxID=497964 RepID=B4CTX8_9BACT|nr:PQQ-binding-like beta-propeller repeat protein [Chthoniobacter flavus]EDY22016.1 Pyrrolo-quinoline quinone [Chthoniobacter flavus Ellin428]